MAPIIETERLRLRPFRASDLDAQARILGDPVVTRHISGTPLGREDVWRKMLAAPGMWAFLGYGYWAVERRDDGAFVGQTGFADFKRDMKPSIEGLPEMGWIYAPEVQGQGFAHEAGLAALRWADAMLAGQPVVAIVSPENARSIALAGRLGFEKPEPADYGEDKVLLFRRRPSPAATAPAAATTA